MNHKQKSKDQVARSQASRERRVVVLDIETVALDPTEEKGALDALRGRIVCIGVLIDNGEMVTETSLCDDDERLVITEFWNTIKSSDVIVGHNVIDFDLLFIRQRSWILGIQPSRPLDTRKFYSTDVIDSMQLWTNWGHKKGATLNALGVALGCGGKTGNGANVAKWWADRDMQKIKAYCQQDVRLAYRVFCRLTYQEPRQIAIETQSMSAASTAAGGVAADEDYARTGSTAF
ncbi:MAG: ribonuclease H-like domain-containing protein [Terriglobales bacterium]